VSEFGVAKVIGGNYSRAGRSTIYKQVVGQQNFSMGAVSAWCCWCRPCWPSSSTAR